MSNNPSQDDPDLESDGVDPIDQQLVAYLDDELEDSERRELEERLLQDDSLRRRLSELQSGWEMLDYLPPSAVTEDFARTTVEMVAATQSQLMAVHSRRRPWRLFSISAAMLALTLALGWVGYSIPVAIEARAFQQQLDDLPLAEHLDAYLVDMDLELVQQLSVDPAWEESIRLGRNAGGIVVADSIDLGSRPNEEKLRTVKAVDTETRRYLERNWERLQALTPQRLEALRQRAAEIAADEHPTKILSTLNEYAVWYAQLSSESQDRIRTAKGEEKLETIRQLLWFSKQRWIRNFGSTLSEAERDLIYERLKALAEDRLNYAHLRIDALGLTDEEIRSKGLWWYDTKPEQFLGFYFWANLGYRSGDRGPGPGGPSGPGTPGGGGPPTGTDPVDKSVEEIRRELMTYWNDEELEKITDMMSPTAKLILNAESPNLNDKRRTIVNWCDEVVMQKSPRNNGAESAQRYYRLLDDDKREVLDLQPPAEILDQLRFGGRGRGGSGRGR